MFNLEMIRTPAGNMMALTSPKIDDISNLKNSFPFRETLLHLRHIGQCMCYNTLQKHSYPILVCVMVTEVESINMICSYLHQMIFQLHMKAAHKIDKRLEMLVQTTETSTKLQYGR